MRLCSRTHGRAYTLVRCDEGSSHGTASFLYFIHRNIVLHIQINIWHMRFPQQHSPCAPNKISRFAL